MKNVRNVKNSLKFKATPKSGALTVRIGVKKYVLPVEARMLNGEGYLFLSFSALSEIFKIENGELVAMAPETDANEAFAALNPGRKRRGRSKKDAAVELPSELEAALKNIPAGYRLGFAPDGSARLVKTRVRKKSAK